MADEMYSALSDGGGLAAADEFAVARSGSSLRVTPIGVPVLVYRYTVTGSDKSGIDTGVDTPNAGSNDWTNGDLLEIWLYCRTDNAVAIDDAFLTFNNDSGGTQYVYERVRAADAVNPVSAANHGAANLDLFVAGASADANVFSTDRVIVPNYAGTVGYKAFEASGGQGGTSATDMTTYVGSYRSTAAITRLALANTSAKKFKVGTQLLIYKRLAS